MFIHSHNNLKPAATWPPLALFARGRSSIHNFQVSGPVVEYKLDADVSLEPRLSPSTCGSNMYMLHNLRAYYSLKIVHDKDRKSLVNFFYGY